MLIYLQLSCFRMVHGVLFSWNLSILFCSPTFSFSFSFHRLFILSLEYFCCLQLSCYSMVHGQCCLYSGHSPFVVHFEFSVFSLCVSFELVLHLSWVVIELCNRTVILLLHLWTFYIMHIVLFCFCFSLLFIYIIPTKTYCLLLCWYNTCVWHSEKTIIKHASVSFFLILINVVCYKPLKCWISENLPATVA